MRKVRDQIGEVFAHALRGVDHVGVLDFPEYSNVGDSAIWAGQVRILERLGIEIVEVSTRHTFSPSRLRQRLGSDGAVCINGGGNFGDLWPGHQEFRHRVLTALDGHRIVQFPQTVHFETEHALAESRRRFSAAHDVSIMVRDDRSARLVRGFVPDERILLCPDAALALDLSRRGAHETEILWLLRGDKERGIKPGGPHPPEEITSRVSDWPSDPLLRKPGPTFRRTQVRMRSVRRLIARGPMGVYLWEGKPYRWHQRAEQRVAGGTRLLSDARVVVTDRLHGHIMCLLLGIPHVVLDNSYGKVHGFVQQWSTSNDSVLLASSVVEANSLAIELLRGAN